MSSENKRETAREKSIKIIEKWQCFWMNQTQNNEADRKNYFHRACGVDANMKYHLAGLVADDLILKSDYDKVSESMSFYMTELAKAKVEIDILRESFKQLADSCEWYADKGTEQERHHFLKVEAKGSYLDSAENEIKLKKEQGNE